MDLTRKISARFPDLAGKVAIVTGTARGLGLGLAEFLALQKMRLVLVARGAEALDAFARDLASQGADCLAVAADLAKPEYAQRVCDEALRKYGAIDLLVNNAAQTRSKSFIDLDEEWYRNSFEGNMRMIYGLSRPVVKHMIDRKAGGCVVNISSVGALRAHRGLAGYDAAKGAMDALTRAMACELAPHNIRVNSVAPGATRRRPDGPWQQKWLEQSAKLVPLGRMAYGEEIGAMCAMLASDAGEYITGQVIYIDGGLTSQLVPPGMWV
jgi:3-oxoacyl-[acyl-carrier protein] reductase